VLDHEFDHRYGVHGLVTLKEGIMHRTSVSSSNLASVGYDPQTRTLEIEFHSGSSYQYFHVPDTIYHGLMSAPSHGRYFDADIKKAGYAYRRVR
jgi:hypothetical protein